MSKIVWTDYLTEQAVFRLWYTLENNNFKNAIKTAQKNAKMSYSIMHNALYSGLYYPQNNYEYGFRAIKQIREDKQLSVSSTIANFMDRDEILRNIHAMFECASAVRKFAPYGYNTKLFAGEFFAIGAAEANKSATTKVDAKLLNITTPNQNELAPNKPNRYRLSKSLIKVCKEKPMVLSTLSTQEKKKKFEQAYTSFTAAKQAFEMALVSYGVADTAKREKLNGALDSGFYRTAITNYGFNIADILKEGDKRSVITKKELLGHARKFEQATNVVQTSTRLPLVELAEKLKASGEQSRALFVKNNRTYPECNKGFVNAFCEMLAKVYEYDASILENGLGRSLPEVMDILMNTLSKLQKQYTSATAEDKKQIEEQVQKIKNAFEASNENNI